MQHLASAAGALLASPRLSESAEGHLVGMDRLASVAVWLVVAVPLLLWGGELRVRTRERDELRGT